MITLLIGLGIIVGVLWLIAGVAYLHSYSDVGWSWVSVLVLLPWLLIVLGAVGVVGYALGNAVTGGAFQ